MHRDNPFLKAAVDKRRAQCVQENPLAADLDLGCPAEGCSVFKLELYGDDGTDYDGHRGRPKQQMSHQENISLERRAQPLGGSSRALGVVRQPTVGWRGRAGTCSLSAAAYGLIAAIAEISLTRDLVRCEPGSRLYSVRHEHAI